MANENAITKIQLKTKTSPAEGAGAVALSEILLTQGEPLVNTNDKTVIIGNIDSIKADSDNNIILRDTDDFISLANGQELLNSRYPTYSNTASVNFVEAYKKFNPTVTISEDSKIDLNNRATYLNMPNGIYFISIDNKDLIENRPYDRASAFIIINHDSQIVDVQLDYILGSPSITATSPNHDHRYFQTFYPYETGSTVEERSTGWRKLVSTAIDGSISIDSSIRATSDVSGNVGKFAGIELNGAVYGSQEHPGVIDIHYPYEDENLDYSLRITGGAERNLLRIYHMSASCPKGDLADIEAKKGIFEELACSDINSHEIVLRQKSSTDAASLTLIGGNIFLNDSSEASRIKLGWLGDDDGWGLDCGGTVKASKFNATSDARLKENFQPLIPEKSILDLPTYKFDFINGAKNQIGCKAQDLQEICPEIVNEDENGMLSIQESKIVYLLLAEVKKLRKELAELKGV